MSAVVRRVALAMMGALAIAGMGSAARAHAALPDRVAQNLKGITEFQYKLLSPQLSEYYAYPACHRVCRLLWKRERALSPSSTDSQKLWREMYLLGLRTQLFKGFVEYQNQYGFTLPADGAHMEENIIGSANYPVQRFLGVHVPQGSTASTKVRYVTTGTRMASETGSTPDSSWDVHIDAPTSGWMGGSGTTDQGGCPGAVGGDVSSPGPEFQEFVATGFCSRWNAATNHWDILAGVKVHVWFLPATFDGSPRLTPGTYTDATTRSSTVVDPRFSVAKSAVTQQLTGAEGDYANLISWIDVQLGGDGHFAPGVEQFYGGVNPGAPNLKHTCAADPVDCATGNFSESYGDTRVAGPGITLSQTRNYNSQAAANATTMGAFGFGWSARFRDYLEFPAGTEDVIVHHDNGSQVRFTHDDEDGSYSPDNYVQSSLTKLSDGSFKYVLSNQMALIFDGLGLLQSETDTSGNATTMHYVGTNLTSVSDAVGRNLTYTYNADGTVATATDPAGNVVHYTYDAGNLSSVTDVGGATTQFSYDSQHQITSITDPLNHTAVTNVYDSQHRVVSQKDAQNHETTWTYGANHTTITDPSGAITDETFKDNLPIKIVRAQGTPSEATTTFEYDDDYNLARETDPNGHHWDSEYDLRGNRIKVTDPLGRSTVYTYDGAHRITSVTKPGGAKTTISYDLPGNLVSTSLALANGQTETHNFSHGAHGLLTEAMRQNQPWRYGYDSQGNRTSTRSPMGHVATATYDANGFQLTSSTPLGKTTTTVRNAYELPTSVTDPRGKTTTYGYDAALNLTDVTDRDGHHDITIFDSLNRPIEVHRADGSVWTTAYTASGEIASRSDGLGRTTAYTYDHQHRPRTVTDPLGRATLIGYDAAGNKTSVENPDHQITTLGYDLANQPTSTHYSSEPSRDVAYGYNTDGQRTSMTDATGTTSYSYDSIGRLTSQTSGAGQLTAYHYDLSNRLTSIDYPDGLTPVTVGSGTAPTHVTTGTVTRAYNDDDQLTSITDWLAHTTSFTYNNDGALTHTTRPNGVDASYTYDDNGALASVADNSPMTALGRSDAGLLQSTNDGISPASFAYDAAQRLTSGLSRTYTYDNADNLTQTATPTGAAVTQNFDAANQLSSRTDGPTITATFAYDNQGRRTGTTPAVGSATAFTWSQADQLMTYSGPDQTGVASGAITEQYGYDGDGLRQTKSSDGQRTHEAYDVSGGLPLMIVDGATAYITGPGGLPLEQLSQGGTVRYFHHDQLGSTTSLTTVSGITAQTYSYDAYGQLTSSTPTVENPFRYAGQYTDDRTGLQYLRARYYDPATGQFLSRDPLEDSTLQPYAYAGNSPTNASDPAGLSVWTDISDAASSAGEVASNGAAGVLSGLSAGYSTKLAGAILGFDAECAHFGTGFGSGQMVGMIAGLLDGEGEAAIAAGATAKAAKGGRGILGRLADETGSFSNLSLSDLRAVRSLDERAIEHEAKLDAYKADPDAFDHLGILKNAPSAEIRQRIINGRIRHLENEISTFRQQIRDITGE